jgi:hypothetical protein
MFHTAPFKYDSKQWFGRRERSTHKDDSENSHPLLSRRDYIVQPSPQKELIEELRTQWKDLWRERIDDKVRAEGIANKEYLKLSVDKGTVILATRNFKLLDFRDILEQNFITDANRFIPPNPLVGGWRKFIRSTITSQKPVKRTRRAWNYPNEKKKQQLKKGGRGWLHI